MLTPRECPQPASTMRRYNGALTRRLMVRMRTLTLSFIGTLAILLAACQPVDPTSSETAAAPTAAPKKAKAVDYSFGPEISAEDLAQHVQVLASDAFGGRAPGTEGEQLTVDYIVAQYKRLGLQPGNGDSYTQTVPMIEATIDPTTALTVRGTAGDSTLAFGTDMVISTTTGEPEVKIEDSEMIFVGYGVSAPESNWNDYSVDVKGKTVVMLVNDPGFHVGNENLFGGKRMTY